MYISAKDRGTVRLSSISSIFEDSTIVVIKIDNIPGMIYISGIDKIIIREERKNATDPSSDLLNIFTFPYFFPIRAARVSDILIINNEAIAISLLNNIITIEDDRSTKLAPVNLFDSSNLVIEEKNISYILEIFVFLILR